MYLDWLRENFRKKKDQGATQKDLADALGLSITQASRLLSGKRHLMASELPILSAYFGEPLPTMRTSKEQVPASVIKLRAIAAPGVWRERGNTVMLGTELIGALRNPNYRDYEQFAVKIEGTKKFAICIPPDPDRVETGQVVLVERERDDMVETTIRVVCIRGGALGTSIYPESHDQNQVFHSLADTKLVGRVIGFFEEV